MDIETHHFDSHQEGAHLLVFGAIHGNEKCGSQACFKMIRDLEEGSLKLTQGHITFIPTCNPKSYANNVRYTDVDLNRIVTHHSHPKYYEQFIANALIKHIDTCDTLLDLHSMSADSQPCTFMDYPTKENIALTRAINAPHVLMAWETVYEDLGNCISTEHYAHKAGKSVITLECGQHQSDQAPTIAYNAIYNSMVHLGLINNKLKRPKHKQEYFKFTHMFCKQEGAAFAQNWHHMEPLHQGQIIGKDSEKVYISENLAEKVHTL
jgi:predicted deacylase